METAGHGLRVDGIRLAAACGLVLVSFLGSPASSATSRRGAVEGRVTTGGLSAHAAVVSLEAPGLATAAPSAPVSMDQKGFTFVPHLLAIVRGSTVRFLNGDPEPHNVYSPEGRYDLGTWGRGDAREHTFDMPGVYTQRCSLHPEMVSYVVVLGTPYFAITDSAGRFDIRDVDTGTYKLVVWSRRSEGLEREVTVAPGRTLRLDLVLKH
jgi:plastocyanin